MVYITIILDNRILFQNNSNLHVPENKFCFKIAYLNFLNT